MIVFNAYFYFQFIKEQSDGISNLGKEIRFFFLQILNIVEEKSSLIILNNNSGTSYVRFIVEELLYHVKIFSL